MNMHSMEAQQLPNGMIRIGRVSPMNGETNHMDLPISAEQLQEFCTGGAGGRKVQQIFPGLDPDQREFIKTGYTPDDWKVMFPQGPTLIYVERRKLVKVGDVVEANGKKATIESITFRGCAQVILEDGTRLTRLPKAIGAKWVGKDSPENEDELET